MSGSALEIALILLGCGVLGVVICRSLQLPPILGYLLVGVAIGPHALGWVPDTPGTRYLAEFGVVFLMFSIGLEFSLGKLHSMRRQVFGLGLVQVGVTLLIGLAAGLTIGPWFGLGWQGSLSLAAVLAMSSTAIVSRLLADRLELDKPHGRYVFGVLLFQDLAVVPLLIVIPALSRPVEELLPALVWSLLKAALVLGFLLFLGQKLMRRWLNLVARRRSQELFMLNLLLMALGLSWVTEHAGLSLALGAFVAGILVAETEYRHQVEDDIKPFRDVLLGLFFVTVGMMLNLQLVWQHALAVLLVLLGLMLFKLVLIGVLSRLFGASTGDAIRTGLALCQAGEFGFVLLNLAAGQSLLPSNVHQIVLAAMLLSMVLTPLLIQQSERIVLKIARSEWMLQSLQLTRIAARSISTERHAIICGYGRSGQNLARLLDVEAIPYVALDLDPDRVRLAAASGESVVYGDAARREALVAAGIHRADALIITFANTAQAIKVIHHAHTLAPKLPIVVRTYDDSDIDRLYEAGAAEVIPEIVEGSLMLASHALLLLGVPIPRVLRRVSDARDARYGLMRGWFRGADDADEELLDPDQPRLQAFHVPEGSELVGQTLASLGFELLGVAISGIRRRGERQLSASPELILRSGDVLLLRGKPGPLAEVAQRYFGG
jgi:CPA2 family monovalent cation:H+ antiporter-2